MKGLFLDKHPYISTVLIGLLCVFGTALGSAIPQIIGLSSNMQTVITALFIAVTALVGILIMKKSKYSLSDFGFKGVKKHTFDKVVFYIPLILVEFTVVLSYGLNAKMSIQQYLFLIIFVSAVGFNEEIYFRGLSLRFLKSKGVKQAIIVSSCIFGILHIANVLGGANLIYTAMQIFFAFLVGFVLAEIVIITKSLWIAIIWHSLHDFIAMSTEDLLDTKAIIVMLIQIILLLIYAIILWKKATDESES